MDAEGKVYAISLEMLQDLFDGGVETAGMGRSEGLAFYLEQIRREHQFCKAHGFEEHTQC